MGISYLEYPWYHIHLFLLSDYRHNVIIYFLPQCCPHHKGLYPQIVSQKTHLFSLLLLLGIFVTQ